MVELVKKHWIKLLIGAEVIWLLMGVFSYVRETGNLQIYEFTREQLLEQGTMKGRVDESCAPGLYYVTNEFILPKGYYLYKVDYTGLSEGSTIYPYCYTDRYKAVEGGERSLDGEDTREPADFWVRANLEIGFYVQYDGKGAVSLDGIQIEQTPVLASRRLFSRIAALAALNLLPLLWRYHKRRGIKPSDVYAAMGILTLALVASYPVTTGYSYLGHDFFFHMTRIEGLKDGLLSGQFPVRLNPTFYFGYGYANSILYGETLLYFPALLRLAGFSLTGAYNAYIVFVNLLTSAAAYWSFSRICGDRMSGMTAAVLYVLNPYRLMDAYLRAAVGEYSAMIFLPVVIYGMYRIYMEDVEKKEYRFCFLTLTVGLTGLIQTHVLTTEMAVMFILMTCVFLVWKTFQKKRFLALLKAAGAAILINFWFIVPFLDYYLTQDMRFLARPATAKIQRTGASLAQLMSMFSEYAWADLDTTGLIPVDAEMPQSIGLAIVLGMALCLGMLLVPGKKEREAKRKTLYLFLTGCLSVWMATRYFPWDRLTDMGGRLGELLLVIQYSWRYLAVASALTAAAIGMGLYLLKRQEGGYVCAAAVSGLCVLACVSGVYFMTQCMNEAQLLKMNDLEGVNTQHAASTGEYALSKGEYDVVKDIWDPRAFGEVQIQNYEKKGSNVRIYVKNGGTDGYVLLPVLAYKGYTASSADGVITGKNLSEGPAAVIQVNIPKDFEGEIKVWFQGFWYWRAAELISLGVVLAIVVLYVKDRRTGDGRESNYSAFGTAKSKLRLRAPKGALQFLRDLRAPK